MAPPPQASMVAMTGAASAAAAAADNRGDAALASSPPPPPPPPSSAKPHAAETATTTTLVTADAACGTFSLPRPLNLEAMFSVEGKARRMAGLRELVTASAAKDKALSPRRREDEQEATVAKAAAKAAETAAETATSTASTSSSSSAAASAKRAEAASVIGLHGGFPPASSFPFVKLTATLRDGTTIEIDDPAEVFSAQQYSVELRGYGPLHSWAARHVLEQHSPPGGVVGFEGLNNKKNSSSTSSTLPPPLLPSPPPPPPHDVMVTNGNNPTLEALLRLFCDRGDDLLCEEYTYPHVAESLALPAGIVPVPVACDDGSGKNGNDGNNDDGGGDDDGGGIIPEALEAAIAARAASRPDGRPPKLLYTVPVGQNPTGAVASEARRRAVYEVCRRWGVVIVEDDPYYYLQYGGGGGGGGGGGSGGRGDGGEKKRRESPRGLSGLGVSYLSLDVDGRVVRLDSFSKVLFPGVRLGWATGPRAVIDKLVCHLHGVALGAPPLAQVVTSALLLRGWGDGGGGNGGGGAAVVVKNGDGDAGGDGDDNVDDGGVVDGKEKKPTTTTTSSFPGFEKHVKEMQREYARRALVASNAADRHLRGLATWRRPSAGMFLWARLADDLAPAADAALAKARSPAVGVVVVPGAFAHCSGDRRRPCPCFRLSFAGASDEALEEGIARLGKVLRETREEMSAAMKS